MPIPREDNNTSNNFEPYLNKESTLDEQDIQNDHINLIGKSLDIGSYIKDNLLGYTPHNKLFVNEL